MPTVPHYERAGGRIWEPSISQYRGQVNSLASAFAAARRHGALTVLLCCLGRITTRPKRRSYLRSPNDAAASTCRSGYATGIGVINRVFRFTRVRYRGLTKNRDRLVVAVPWPTYS